MSEVDISRRGVSAGLSAVDAVECRAAAYDAMEHRRKMRKILRNFIGILLNLLVLAGLWYGFLKLQESRSEARLRERAAEESVARANEAAAKARAAALEKSERIRQEREAKAIAEREKVESEKSQREQERQLVSDLFRVDIRAFRENDFRMFAPSVTNKVALAGGRLAYLFPESDNSICVYEVRYEPGGTCKVRRYREDGSCENVDGVLFDSKLAGYDYLVADGENVYLRVKRRNKLEGPFNPNRNAQDPHSPFFGALSPLVKELDPVYEGLSFDILFVSGDGKVVKCQNVRFGDTFDKRTVRDSVEAAYPFSKADVGKFHPSKYKYTAKMYSGAWLRRGSDGIWYVPLMYNGRTCGDHSVWLQKKAIAERDAKMEKQHYDDERARYYDAMFKRDGEAGRAYVKKIDEIINAGTLRWRARKSCESSLIQ